jgi:hypothetical protein
VWRHTLFDRVGNRIAGQAVLIEAAPSGDANAQLEARREPIHVVGSLIDARPESFFQARWGVLLM